MNGPFAGGARRWPAPAVILLILAGWALASLPTVAATPTDTITLTAPNNITIPEVEDYATSVLQRPANMNSLEDLAMPYQFTAPTVSGGLWHAVATGNTPEVWLQEPGYDIIYSWFGQKNGPNYPINGAVFTHMRVRMNLAQGGNAVVYWYAQHQYTPLGNSAFINWQPGWHIYDIDLTAAGGSGSPWTAQPVAGVRWDLPLNHPGNDVQIDWVRLTRPTSQAVQITWNYTSSSNPTVSLYLSTDPSATGADEQLIASVPASAQSYTWTGAGMAPGTYYIHAAMNGARAASGPLNIAAQPIVRIDAPSAWSGEDYAAAHLGAVWNGANAQQFPVTYNVAPIAYTPDYLQTSATNPDPTDPEVWWLAYDQAHAIDTSRYRYMNTRLWVQTPSGSPTSWSNRGPRLAWSVPVNLNWQQTRAVSIPYNTWQSITYDLPNTPLEPGFNSTGWASQVTTLRFDPHEQDDSGQIPDFFRIGGAHLTSQPMSNQATLIRWTPLQGSGTINLYWDADNHGFDGTLIASGVPLSQGSYSWNTVALPNGTYWVYVITADTVGGGSAAYSLVPVVVNHAAPSTIFSDVPTNYFVATEINDLATRGIINGYAQPDTTVLFLPGNPTTRGQLSKMIVLARGWTVTTPPTPTFADVSSGNTFYGFIETAYAHGVISGYQCGGPGEPCDGQNRPYFRPGNNVTRGQTAKIIVLAFAWAINTSGGPHFTDVGTGNGFYSYVETAFNRGIISGYADNTFRPGANVTRGQLAKMLSRSIASP